MGTPTSQTPPLPLPLREGDFFEAVRGAGNYRVQAQDGSVVQATTAVKGVARTATPAQAVAGGPGELVVSPAGVAAAIDALLSTRIVAGEGVETDYTDGVLTISPIGGGGGTAEFTVNPGGGYYAWEGFPCEGIDGSSAGGAQGGTFVLAPFANFSDITPGEFLDFTGIGCGFVEETPGGDVFFMLGLDGADGSEDITVSFDWLDAVFNTADATYGMTDYGRPVWAWLVTSWTGPDIPPEDGYPSGVFSPGKIMTLTQN